MENRLYIRQCLRMGQEHFFEGWSRFEPDAKFLLTGYYQRFAEETCFITTDHQQIRVIQFAEASWIVKVSLQMPYAALDMLRHWVISVNGNHSDHGPPWFSPWMAESRAFPLQELHRKAPHSSYRSDACIWEALKQSTESHLVEQSQRHLWAAKSSWTVWPKWRPKHFNWWHSPQMRPTNICFWHSVKTLDSICKSSTCHCICFSWEFKPGDSEFSHLADPCMDPTEVMLGGNF